MNNWIYWNRGRGRPIEATGVIDVKYLDGKEFTQKLAENCYWGGDSLIEYWRPYQSSLSA